LKKQKSHNKNQDAMFYGLQETLTGERFALYIISKADHPSYGSSVSENTLKRLNPEIPEQHFPTEGMKV
jgi:hypothetical protein